MTKDIQNENNIQALFNNLDKLAADPENTFHRIDTLSSMGTKMVIFGYHIASYSDWLNQDALESRGIMFEINDEGIPVRIACRPFQKFFNYKENPFTEKLNDSEVQYIFKKEDGSLISTFIDKDHLFVKSKGSLFSQQALDAQKWLYEEKRRPLLNALKEYSDLGYTINMEWVSPDNRIVLNYSEPRLIILNARNNLTGEYVAFEALQKDSQINQYLVEPVQFDSVQEILDSLESLEQEEGYVIWTNDKPFCKLKCPWYVHLHSIKSSVNSDKNLWESVAEGLTDDIKTLFQTDLDSLNRISEFERIYKNSFNLVYTICFEVYNELQGQSRKDYAINAQSKLNQIGHTILFSIVMRMYLNGLTDETIDMIKDHLVKYRDLYLIKE